MSTTGLQATRVQRFEPFPNASVFSKHVHGISTRSTLGAAAKTHNPIHTLHPLTPAILPRITSGNCASDALGSGIEWKEYATEERRRRIIHLGKLAGRATKQDLQSFLEKSGLFRHIFTLVLPVDRFTLHNPCHAFVMLDNASLIPDAIAKLNHRRFLGRDIEASENIPSRTEGKHNQEYSPFFPLRDYEYKLADRLKSFRESRKIIIKGLRTSQKRQRHHLCRLLDGYEVEAMSNIQRCYHARKLKLPGGYFVQVNLSTTEKAKAAADALDGLEICGTRLRVYLTRPLT